MTICSSAILCCWSIWQKGNRVFEFYFFFSSFSFLSICIHFHNLILYFSFHKNAFFILLLLYIDTYTYTYTKNSSKDIGNKNETLLFPHHFTDFSCKTAKFKSFELWKKNGFLWQTFFCTTSCSSFINGSKGKRCKYIYIKLKKSCIWFSTNIIDRAGSDLKRKKNFFFHFERRK